MGLAATDHAILLEPADALVSRDSWADFPSAAINPNPLSTISREIFPFMLSSKLSSRAVLNPRSLVRRP